jgi:hypothetical protein
MKYVFLLSMFLVGCIEKKVLLVPWGDQQCGLIHLKYNEKLHVYEMGGWEPVSCPPNPSRRWASEEIDAWHKQWGICSTRLGDTNCARPDQDSIGLDGKQ